MQAIKAGVEKTAAEVDRLMAGLNSRLSSDPNWKTLGDTWTQHKAVVARIVDLALQNSNGRAFDILRNECNPLRKAEDDAFVDLIGKQEAYFAAATGRADESFRSSLITLLAVAGGGILVGLALSWVTVSRLTRSLLRIVDRLDGSSTQVSDAAISISGSSQQLAEGATAQAASLEETSSVLEEMASMTRQNADNANRTAQSTDQTVKRINEGSKAVGNMSEAMGEINESAEKIGDIIKTIEDLIYTASVLPVRS
jgi:methyl-accepting chemotaxis protein